MPDVCLIDKNCKPCEGGVPPLTPQETAKFMTELTTPWEIVEDKKIVRRFSFKDFKAAMTFVNKVAEIAESEGHHPDIFISYNKVKITLWTHAIGGLSENDFILAAKIEALL